MYFALVHDTTIQHNTTCQINNIMMTESSDVSSCSLLLIITKDSVVECDTLSEASSIDIDGDIVGEEDADVC